MVLQRNFPFAEGSKARPAGEFALGNQVFPVFIEHRGRNDMNAVQIEIQFTTVAYNLSLVPLSNRLGYFLFRGDHIVKIARAMRMIFRIVMPVVIDNLHFWSAAVSSTETRFVFMNIEDNAAVGPF